MTITKYANMDLLGLPDCAGLTDEGKCRWMTYPACRGRSCKYAKPREADALGKVYARLCALDEQTQARISQKYYGGSRPWLEGSESSGR